MNGFTPGIPLGANCTKTMTLMRYRKFYKKTKELLQQCSDKDLKILNESDLNDYHLLLNSLIWRITNEQLQRD